MDGNYEESGYNYKNNNISTVSLHDARISCIKFDDKSISFHFPEGITLTSNGEKTGKATVKLLLGNNDINVFVSKKIKKLLGNNEKYVTQSIPLKKLLAKFNTYDFIEIVDSMNEGDNFYLWRGVFLNKKGYCNYYIEFQFISCDQLQWEIQFN